MGIFKSKWFNKWAAKEGLPDKVLIDAVRDLENGLNDGDLGAHVYKKRAPAKDRVNEVAVEP